MIWRQSNPNDPQQNKDAPPDLEAFLKKWFGGGKKKGNSPHSPKKPEQSFTLPLGKIISLVVLVALIIWVLSGIYVVKPAEQGAVLRFGKYIQTVDNGPHWFPPLIDQVLVKNVDQQKTISLAGTMLTGKENLVDVEFALQYRIDDLGAYLFNAVNPEGSLKEILDSAVRQAVGTSLLSNILTQKRAEVAQKVEKTVTKLVDRYQLGIKVVDLKMLVARPPEEVKAAFDDVSSAREDRERFVNLAQAKSNSMIPLAEGQAKGMLKQADAYKQEQIFKAKGGVARFKALLPQYTQAKQVTATRLYFDAMENVLQNSHVVLVNKSKGGNMFYVPLDKLSQNFQTKSQDLSSTVQNIASTAKDNYQKVHQSFEQGSAGSSSNDTSVQASNAEQYSLGSSGYKSQSANSAYSY